MDATKMETPRYKNPPAKFTSKVWKYFGISTENEKKAVCKTCNAEQTYTGGTTNLSNHMKRHHNIDPMSKDVPKIMILTKIDLVCEEVKKDFSKTFKSKKVQDVVKRASELFGVQEMYIHPVKNFTDESSAEYKQGILLLLALKSALNFAKGYIEELDTRNEEPEHGHENVPYSVPETGDQSPGNQQV